MSDEKTVLERREFLKAGAAAATVAGAAGVAGLGGASCAGLFSDGSIELPQLPLPDMDSYLERVDKGLEFISEAPWSDDPSDDDREDPLDMEDGLGRKALRSIYLAGMLGDLPEEGQVHPGMQARVRRALPEMEEAVFGVRDYLANMTEEDAAEIQRFLLEHEDAAMAIAEQLDRRIVDTGASTKRRMQARAVVAQIMSRLKNQPPKTVFDDYVGKVDRRAAQAGSVAETQRRMVAQLGEQAFWERQQRLAVLAARWQEEGAMAGGSATDALPAAALADAGAPADEADAGPAETGPPAAADDEPSGDELDQAVATEREALRRELENAGVGAVDFSQPLVESPEAERERIRERRRVRGAWCLGIGGISLGLGGVFMLILLFTDEWALFVGGILGTVGVTLLIIGAIIFIVRAAAG